MFRLSGTSSAGVARSLTSVDAMKCGLEGALTPCQEIPNDSSSAISAVESREIHTLYNFVKLLDLY